MAPRRRTVVWAESAQAGLNDVIAYIAQDSREQAVRVLERALQAASSLNELAERGRVVPEFNDSAKRELFVFRYRLIYEVVGDHVVIQAFLRDRRSALLSGRSPCMTCRVTLQRYWRQTVETRG